MELKIFKSVWGMEGNWNSKLRRISDAGYNGVETPMPPHDDEQHFRELLEKYKLDLVIHVHTGAEDNIKPYPNDVETHMQTFEEQVHRAKSFHPLRINSQSAKDSMKYGDQLTFFEHAIRVENGVKIPIGHETHRSRAMYTPWNTAQLLKDLPELRIVADFSHWCNVCESKLEDQKQNLEIAMKRAIHIHGRVGYDEGPQVPDFRAPEYKEELHLHEQWWDTICVYHLKNKEPYVTFTPEFGPPGYMHTLPYTNQPVVDLWDVCYAMGERFRERFNQR